MEVPEHTCPASPARDQPAPAPGPPGVPGGQASPHLTLGPVLLPPEQGLAPTVFLKALPIPLYHTVPPGGLQPRAPLVTGSLDGGSVPFLLSPLLQPEGPGPAQIRKPATPTLTVSIVGALPVLSPGPGPTPGSLGRARNAGKHLCPHCGRDCLKPSVLEKHIRSHTGERPFPCATCGIAFKTQSNLYKHRRTQTHLHNSRLSSESEGAGPSLLEDKAAQASRTTGSRDSCSLGGGEGAPSERPLSPGVQGAGHCLVPPVHLSPGAKNLDVKPEAVCCPGATPVDREAPLDSTHTASAGLPPAGPQPRRKLSEQKSPTAGRACSLQQQTMAEKPWDSKAAEGRLRKCGSTDSGYLSRSDSSEQPLAPCSPLHSLSEHSAESEGEGAPGPGVAKAELGGQGPGLELEKRQLEERIARLISHNQAVVDDPQLDHVRPRKTVLSKQGSIDLPVPYTYKDSFHFEIRAPEPGRRRRHGALCPARSACTALGAARPLFFHSVPTQLSTTVECVPVTRSNSLPFVEGTRTWQEPLGPQDTCPGRQKPLSPRPAPARLVDSPSGHPRALVRQAAVEDLLCPPTEDASAPTEDLHRKRAVAGEGAASKGRAAGRTPSQRRPRVFSQDKWQMYGNEAFQRAYGTVRTSPQGGRRARAGRVGRGTPLGLPLPEEASGSEGAAPSRDRKTPVCGDASVGTKPGPCGSPPATEDSLGTESPRQRETVARAGGGDQPRVSRPTSPPTLRSGEPPPLGHESPVLPPNGRLELGCQLPPAPGPPKAGDLEAPRLEAGAWGVGDMKEPCQWALTVPRGPSSGSGEPRPGEDTLPSARKTLRVQGLSCPESGPLGAGGQTPGGPEQAASPPSWTEDSDHGDRPGALPGSAGHAEQGRARPWEASASSVALRPAGPRTEEPVPGPAAGAPGGPSLTLGVPAALTDPAFPPKYLLRLPQGETPPPPGAQGPGPGQDPLCRSGRPEEPASSVGSGLGTLLPPHPAAGLAPGTAANFREDPSWPRPWVRRKGVLGDEKGDLDTSTPAARECPGSSAGPPRDTASVLPTLTCDSQRSGAHDTGHLCAGHTWARARPSGGVPNPWALNRDVAGPPGHAPEDPPPGPGAGHSPRGSLPPLGWPERGFCTHSESPGSFGPQGPFPLLKAEPRLTWCCLSRSVPLPTEQKEKAASVYWALHCPGGSALQEGADAWRVSKAVSGQWTRTSPAEGGETRPWKLSYPTAPGMASRDPGSEPGWRKGPPWRRVKMSRGTSRQNKRRRCRGSFLQGRVQLRVSRRRKPPRVPRKDRRPPPLEGLEPRRTLGQASSEMAGLRLLGEPPCATPASSRGRGSGEEEEDRRPVAESSSPGASPRTARERHAWTLKGLVPSAGEHGDCRPQSAVVGSGWALPAAHCVQEASNSPVSCGKDLGMGLPETQRLPLQEQVDPKPCAFSDAQEPSSSESKGRSPGPDVATSVAAVGPSLGAGGGPAALAARGAEPQDHGRVAGETPTQSSPDRKAVAIAQGRSPSLSPGRPSPGPRPSGSVPLRSPGKAHLEIPASGPGLTSSHREEGTPKTLFPSGGQQGCGEVPVPCPPLGKDSEKCQESGFTALKDGAVPSEPGRPTEVPEAPSKATKKRSLEGMRKQTRVELSDTSSDDEDRLVIEI